ncbi:MAG TPA: hypothetical protein VM325_00710 [Alphaproteobacteria bacterium]|nr:hypothetical protein [Alphaproteobacteria bacterium]
MAEPPPGPKLTSEDAAAARRRRRRPILVIVVMFAGYGIYSLLSDSKPGWLASKPQEFPAKVAQLRFADGRLDAGNPYVILLKRAGRGRKLPPRRLMLAMAAQTTARYRCRKPSRCPWISIAPLTCRLGDAAPGPCGLEFFDLGQTGTKLFPRPRCRLTRPGIRDLKIACPRTLTLGAKVALEAPSKPGPKPKSKPAQ